MSRKTILVTGASRGIDKAAAVKFVRRDYNVAISRVRREEQLMRTQREIESSQAPYLAYKGDMEDTACCKGLFLKIKKMFGSVDVFVNNAGISYIGLSQDMSTEDWERMLHTNLTSVFNYCRLVVPYMTSQKQGKTVDVSSVWDVVGMPCETVYSATKGGINVLARALVKKLAPNNAQVNTIACGTINTEMNRRMSEDNLIALVDEIPSGHLGRAEEVADLVYHPGYKESHLIGQVIGLDGEWIQAGEFKPGN